MFANRVYFDCETVRVFLLESFFYQSVSSMHNCETVILNPQDGMQCHMLRACSVTCLGHAWRSGVLPNLDSLTN